MFRKFRVTEIGAEPSNYLLLKAHRGSLERKAFNVLVVEFT